MTAQTTEIQPPAGGFFIGAKRLVGWESRLAAAIEASRHRPYEYGVRDCLQFSLDCAAALTGIDVWPSWQGRYSNRREALAIMARHCGTFEEFFDWFFGAANRIDWRYARRGDIAAVAEATTGRKHLGVVNAGQIFGMAEIGFRACAVRIALCCWRIG